MKKISFVLFSIILLSCNGNNSVRNQETIDADSIATVDTTVTPPMEKKTTPKEESKTINKVSKKRKSENQIAGTYYCRKSGDRYILNHDYSGLFLPKTGETSTIEWYKTGNTVSVTFTGEMAFLGTQILNYVITAKRKACGIKNEMRFSDGKTKCAIKKHPSNETWMLFC